MTGFQVGGDLWLNLIPGVKTGWRVQGWAFTAITRHKTRVYLRTRLPFGPVPEIRERASDGKCAWLIQGSLSSRLSSDLFVGPTGSYQVIYIDNVALAPENINSVPPGFNLANAVRPVRVKTTMAKFFQPASLYRRGIYVVNISGHRVDHDLNFSQFRRTQNKRFCMKELHAAPFFVYRSTIVFIFPIGKALSLPFEHSFNRVNSGRTIDKFQVDYRQT